MRRNLSWLEKLRMRELEKECIKGRLEGTYYLRNMGIKVVIEELKHRITAKAEKIK